MKTGAAVIRIQTKLVNGRRASFQKPKARVVRVSPARICEAAPPVPIRSLQSRGDCKLVWRATLCSRSYLALPSLTDPTHSLSGSRPAPWPGTPGLALALRARGLPAARPRGRYPPPLAWEPRPWVQVVSPGPVETKSPPLLGHPGRALRSPCGHTWVFLLFGVNSVF